MRNLVLIGFMGTGKTTLGRLCAERLGYAFCDTDTLIEARAGRSIPEIFAEQGETAFRQLEREVIAELAAMSGLVIATGGGAPLDAENAHRLRAAGDVVLLTAPPEEILLRVGDPRSRPLLAGASDVHKRIRELLDERMPAYVQAAHRELNTMGHRLEALAERLSAPFQAEQERVREVLRLPVALGERSYDIWLGSGLLAHKAGELLAQYAPGGRACVVTHPVLTPYADAVVEGLRAQGIQTTRTLLPAGERFKTLRTVERVYKALLEARLDRKSLVVAVGGGVLGDLVGFAAATYLRGIRFAQVPTTLLAQVDSSIGGKTGVDLPEGKNLVGAFYQPSLVLMDLQALRTLPARELRSGLAEVIKYGIIYDEALFRQVHADLPQLRRRDLQVLMRAIARSCEIKAEVVAQDETEQGLRAILNFGHTVGHALEAVTHYRRYKHGEAVALGMVAAALIGEEVGVTPTEVTLALHETLQAAGLPVVFPEEVRVEDILAAAQRDKKTEAGRLRFVLARRIGEVFVTGDVTEGAVHNALNRQKRLDYVPPR